MDWLPNFLPFFPAFFRYTTALNFRKGNFYQVQHALRKASSIGLFIFTIYIVSTDRLFSFVKFHDGLIILAFFLAIELSLILKKIELIDLANFITEPVKVGDSSIQRLKYRTYLKFTTMISLISLVIIFLYGIVWPLIPSFVCIFGYKVSLNLPIMWMMNPERTWVFVGTTVFLVVYMVSIVSLVQGWFLTMVVAIMKLSLLTEMLVDDLKTFDVTAEMRCEEFLDGLMHSGRLPYCQACRVSFSNASGPVGQAVALSSVVVLDFRRFCCRRACRDLILQDYQTKCLQLVIVQHQKIIRISRLLDNVYNMTTWAFSKAAVVIVAFVLQRLDELPQRTFIECACIILEVVITPLFVITYCCLGSFLQHQSEKIRTAVYCYPWVDKPEPLAQMIQIMQLISQRDLPFTAAGLYSFNLMVLPSFFQSLYAYTKVMQWMKLRVSSKNEV